jgi:ketosteroid isomerase-like protein
MAHRNEQLIRELYVEFGKGNLDGVLALCTPDIRFHFRGHNALAGDYGRADLSLFAQRLGQLSGQSLRMDIEHVLADDSRGVVFLRDRFTRTDNDKSYEVALLHMYRIDEGKLAAFDELPFDQRAFDEAWATSCAPSAETTPVHSIH